MLQTLTPAEASVLRILRDHRDRAMTSRELQVCGLSETAVNVSIENLGGDAMIVPRRGGWALSSEGKAFAASSRGQHLLDGPVMDRG